MGCVSDLDGYSFEQYVQEFNKTYSGATERDQRRTLLDDKLAKIRAWNARFLAGTQRWWAGVGPFTDRTKAEMRQMRGLSQAMRRAALTRWPQAVLAEPADLPTDVDWRTKHVVTAVKDQGDCGSCWAFSSAATIESHVAIQTGTLIALSEQELVSCAPNAGTCGGDGGCEGAIQEAAYNYTVAAGGLSAAAAATYPYKSGKSGRDGSCDPNKIQPVVAIDGYVALSNNNASQLQTAVANIGPVAISLAANSDEFDEYGGGILHDVDDWIVDHAVQAVGYGYDTQLKMGFWLVRNSYGKSWGDQGYIKIFRQTDGTTPERCGTDTAPEEGDGCPGGPTTITVCGEIGILAGSTYPVGGRLI